LNDPESYAGGSITSGRTSHVRLVKEHDPNKNEYSGAPGLGLGMGLTTPPHKKICSVEKLLRKKRLRSTKGCNTRRSINMAK
jgi:hypothetical protein